MRLKKDRLRITRDTLIEMLKAEGIGTSVHFIPLRFHSYYRQAFGLVPSDLPVASEAAESMISLPLYTRMSDDDVEYVAERVRTMLHANRS